jgi:amino acid adenylation domain-containing protein
MDRESLSVPRVAESEHRQRPATWNHTAIDYPRQLCIHELFEAQVERTPDAMSVVFRDEELSYRELNEHANRLAHYLQGLGVGPEVLVGICVERSLELIVGLLGVLKAGGAYVPLDPAYPKARIAFMLADTGAPVLLTQERLLPQLPPHQARVICLDRDWAAIAAAPAKNPTNDLTPENLAYAIYTSGTTGRRKAVAIPHRPLTSYAYAAKHDYALAPGDRYLQFSSIGWNTSTEEIFPCLAHGATLVLRTDESLESVHGFLEDCHDLKLSIINIPTSYWHAVTARLGGDSPKPPESLRLVIIGGERGLREHLATWYAHVGEHIRIVNTYGATEAGVTTLCDLSPAMAMDEGMTQLPIGRPVPNMRVLVLDPQLRPVPVGTEGEIFIGGEGLARGYLGRPDLTAARFVPDPFGGEPGARLYRTGDLARWRPDGNLEHLGRLHDQVKIRGFRVELGEIEATLVAHPAVREVVVVAQEDEPGERRLIAYVVAPPSSPPTAGELHRFLEQKLPDHAIPSSFVPLDALPLTRNGKVDYRALRLL